MNRSKVNPGSNNKLFSGWPTLVIRGLIILALQYPLTCVEYFCKTSRILNFVGHNVYGCSAEAKATAYTTLVRPLLEFSSAAWDPHLAKDVHQLERVQRLAL